MNYVGIDFGTTKSVVACVDARGISDSIRLGRESDQVPTALHVSAEGVIKMGDDAVDLLASSPSGYVPRIKQKLGLPDRKTKPIWGREYTMIDLAGKFLRFLRDEAIAQKIRSNIEAAVVTVPALYSDQQRDAIREAALQAGFEHVELLAEPQAAGLAFLREYHGTPFGDRVLVFDWGGGTLDIALLERRDDGFGIPVVVGGNEQLGGEDIDWTIFEAFDQSLRTIGTSMCDEKPEIQEQLRRTLRKQKVFLSSQSAIKLSTTPGDGVPRTFKLERTEFEELIRPTVDKAMGCLEQVLVNCHDLGKRPSTVLLVGGTTRMPVVSRTIKDRFSERFGVQPIEWDRRIEAVALGAAIKAHELWGEVKPQEPPPLQPLKSSREIVHDILSIDTRSQARPYARILEPDDDLLKRTNHYGQLLKMACADGHVTEKETQLLVSERKAQRLNELEAYALEKQMIGYGLWDGPGSLASVRIVSVAWTPTILGVGDLLNISFTIRNDGPSAAPTQGPDPGFVYKEGDTFTTRGFPEKTGNVRVGIDFTIRTGIAHPYRWGFGSPLAPGETRTITGAIRLQTSRKTKYWAGLVQEHTAWLQDHFDVTAITVKMKCPQCHGTNTQTVIQTTEDVANKVAGGIAAAVVASGLFIIAPLFAQIAGAAGAKTYEAIVMRGHKVHICNQCGHRWY